MFQRQSKTMTQIISYLAVLISVSLKLQVDALRFINLKDTTLLGFDLEFASVDEIGDRTYLYHIKVKVKDYDVYDSNPIACVFQGEGILSQNVTVIEKTFTGWMHANKQIMPSFSCKGNKEVTYVFRKLRFSSNSTSFYHLYGKRDCGFIKPQHFTTCCLRVLKIGLVCKQHELKKNNFKLNMDGFIFKNLIASPLPSNFFKFKEPKFASLYNDSEAVITMTSERYKALPGSVLLNYSISLLEEEPTSPIESSIFRYYSLRSIDGNSPPLAEAVFGLVGDRLAYKFVAGNEAPTISCIVGSYDYINLIGNTEVYMYKGNILIRDLQRKNVGLYGKYMTEFTYTLPYINESSMGNYTCYAVKTVYDDNDGVRTRRRLAVTKSTIIDICHQPKVKFAIEQNEHEIKAVLETEYAFPFYCSTKDERYSLAPIPIITDQNGRALVTVNTTGGFREGRMEIKWKDEAKLKVPDEILCSIKNMCSASKEFTFQIAKT